MPLVVARCRLPRKLGLPSARLFGVKNLNDSQVLITKQLIDLGAVIVKVVEGDKKPFEAWQRLTESRTSAESLRVLDYLVKNNGNVALIMPDSMGMAWLDFDLPDDVGDVDHYFDALTWDFPELADTLTAVTPSGGRHYLVKTDLKPGAFSFGDYHGEIRRGAGMITLTAPGQVNGKRYEYIAGFGDNGPIILEAGQDLVDTLTAGTIAKSMRKMELTPGLHVVPSAVKYVEDEIDRLRKLVAAKDRGEDITPFAGRNDALNAIAQRVFSVCEYYQLDALAARLQLSEAASYSKNIPALTADEIVKTLDSAYGKREVDKSISELTGGAFMLAEDAKTSNVLINAAARIWLPGDLVSTPRRYTDGNATIVSDGKEVSAIDRATIQRLACASFVLNKDGAISDAGDRRTTIFSDYINRLVANAPEYIPVYRPTPVYNKDGRPEAVLFPYDGKMLIVTSDGIDVAIEYKNYRRAYDAKDVIYKDTPSLIDRGAKLGLLTGGTTIDEDHAQAAYPIALTAWLLTACYRAIG